MGRTTARADERLTTVGLLMESAAGLRRVFQRRLESVHGASGPSFDVLIRLARSPDLELRMSELATQTTLTPSGLTRSVDRLQQQGLVARRVCPEDRRGAFAVLTEEGKALMDRAVPEHVAHIDEVLSALYTAEEERTLGVLLRRLRDHLYEDTGDWSLAPEDGGLCDGSGDADLCDVSEGAGLCPSTGRSAEDSRMPADSGPIS